MTKKTILLTLSLLSALLSGLPAFCQTVNNRVLTNVSVSVPAVVKITGTDNITTVQNLRLDSSNINFDFNLGARGTSIVTWRANTNSNNGLQVTIQRSVVTGSAPRGLQNSILISGEPYSGGDTSAVIASPYTTGKPLPQISESVPDLFCSTNAPGSAQFNVKIILNASSADGVGTVGTVLTFVAAAL
ncbi:MAG: hypothetical protein K2Y39_08010 [Candidatus Obscuribacterales bacterium]|nr:hypothetical protein [Candidatus Obscuribacterales bacterium]